MAEPLAELMDVVQEPFNVNRAALAAGRASLERTALVDDRRLANEAGRERLAERLREAGAGPFRRRRTSCSPTSGSTTWP